MKEKWESLDKGQKITVTAGAFICLLFSPLVSFIFNLGTLVGMGIGAAVIFAALKRDGIKEFLTKLKQKRWGKALLIFVCIICVTALIYCSTVTVLVLSYSTDNKDIPKDTPVIVLGCKVMGSVPGPMLQRRINAAYDYLVENPNAKCIVSGGQGADENISEAQAMYESLTEKGISPDRIFVEDKSTSTYENFKFSKQILDENGLGSSVVVVTTNYHQFRAGLIAENCGLSTYAVSSKTGNFSLPTYVVREWFSVLLVFLRK